MMRFAVNKRLFLMIAFVLIAGLLSSCATGNSGGAKAEKPDEETQEAETAPAHSGLYGSPDAEGLMADMDRAVQDLAASLSASLPPNSGVLVASFVDARNLNETSTLGRLLSARFAGGLSAAGYDVKESRLRGNLVLRPGQGEFILSRSSAELARQAFEVSAVLYGYYIVDSDAVYVSARTALAGDGTVAAAKDFTLLNRRAVTRMLGEDHDSMFDRYVRKPAPVSQTDAGEDVLQERDLTEGPAAGGSPEFRIFPPRRLNP
jgi:hypothetical protein